MQVARHPRPYIRRKPPGTTTICHRRSLAGQSGALRPGRDATLTQYHRVWCLSMPAASRSTMSGEHRISIDVVHDAGHFQQLLVVLTKTPSAA